MGRLELKLELLRSNPLMLRQFAVPEDYTVSQLYQVLRILLGWEEKEAYRFWRGREAFAPKDKVKDLFPGESSLYFQVGTGDEKWVFRLLATGNRDQEQGTPSVIRFRGNNPPRECNGAKKFNELQKYWEKGGWEYFNSFTRSYPEANSSFSMTRTNREFVMAFGTEEEQKQLQAIPDLDYASAIDAKELLGGLTMVEMREVAGRIHLRLPAGLHKDEMVDRLDRSLSDWKTLDPILQKMTLGQYRTFQKLCGTKMLWKDMQARETAYLLTDCCLISLPYFSPFDTDEQRIQLTRELLMSYEEWLAQGLEENFLRGALLRTVLAGCLKLYGCINKVNWMEMAHQWVGKSYSVTELLQTWDSARTWLDPEEYNCEGQDLIFETNTMKKGEAEILIQAASETGYYVPTLEKLQEIEAEGLKFPAKEERMLKNFLKQTGWMPEGKKDWYLSQFYQGLHCQGERAEICRWFSVQEGIRRKSTLRDLDNLLSLAEGTVRRVGLFGYTDQEWAKRQRKRK